MVLAHIPAIRPCAGTPEQLKAVTLIHSIVVVVCLAAIEACDVDLDWPVIL